MSNTKQLSKARSLAQLQADARFVLDCMERPEVTVALQFATMRQMRTMKKKFLGKDQEVVDVLAFPLADDFPDPLHPGSLGDVYLNWDAFKTDLPHLQFLLVHGILHLLGYTHDGKDDILIMESLERTLCHRIASRE